MEEKRVESTARRRNRRGMWVFARLGLIVALIVGFGISALAKLDEVAEIEAEIARIEAQIAVQQMIAKEVEDEVAFTQSREFIERMAWEWFGLVHRDEIIFIMVE